MSDGMARGDVRVSGAGTVPTGVYDTVSVSGSATLHGAIECTALKVSGAAEGEGTLHADSVTVHGSLGYRGDVEVNRVRVSGTASFGKLNAEDVGVSGTLSVGGLTGGTVKVQGYLASAGDCEAEHFIAQGAFSIKGLLNAGTVDITLGGKCTAGEIGGETVIVRNYPMGALKRLVTSLVPGLELRLVAESIEGDDVQLERTTARAVRGTTVTIGPECSIDLVEYTAEYSASPDAKITEVRKVGGGESEGGDAGA